MGCEQLRSVLPRQKVSLVLACVKLHDSPLRACWPHTCPPSCPDRRRRAGNNEKPAVQVAWARTNTAVQVVWPKKDTTQCHVERKANKKHTTLEIQRIACTTRDQLPSDDDFLSS